MNAKRWFAWVCLALMLVAEGLLFHSNHERDAALAQLTKAQQELSGTAAERDALKNSSAGQQATLIAYLKGQNETLAAKVKALQANLDQLQAQSQQTAEHLSTARSALQLQQEHMQQLQVQQQQAVEAANTIACINNLRALDSAKLQWALEKQKTATDVPTAQDLLPYLKDGVLPVCPDGGTYTLNAAGEQPICSVPGHVLPAQ